MYVRPACCMPPRLVWDSLSDHLQYNLQLYTGGSVSGAAFMNESTADICLNWAGTKTRWNMSLPQTD